MGKTTPWPWVWLGSLTCFLIAAATGALYHFGLLYGLTAGLVLSNVRYVYSHS